MVKTIDYRAQFVRRLREQFDCSQEEFARIVGVTTSALSRWENGRAQMNDRTWEHIHELKHAFQATDTPGALKRKLLVADVLLEQTTPLEQFLNGELDDALRQHMDEDQLLEDVYLESGLKWDERLQRKLDHWINLVRQDEIPLDNKDAWEQLTQYVVPVARLTKFLSGVGIMSDESRARFAGKVFWIDCNRTIKREPLVRLLSYGTRIEGYAVVLVELIRTLEMYQSDIRSHDELDFQDKWETVEGWWNRVSDWKGNQSINQLLNPMKQTCSQVLSGIECQYAPKGVKILQDQSNTEQKLIR